MQTINWKKREGSLKRQFGSQVNVRANEAISFYAKSLPDRNILMQPVLRFVVAFCILFGESVLADSFDINMNNNAVQVKSGFAPDQLSQANAEFQTGVLYNDQGNLLAEAGVSGNGPPPEDDEDGKNTRMPKGLIAGGTGGFLLGSLQQGSSTRTVSCLAIGPRIGFTFPTDVPISIIVEYRTSLKIISFLDASRFSQFGLSVEAKVPSAKIYLGYREINFGINGAGDAILDKGVFIGVNFTYGQ